MATVLYLSQTGMTEPLGRSQVLGYVSRLARRGHSFDVVCLEPEDASAADIAATRARLAAEGIGYFALRRRRSHGLAVKVAESAHALATALRRGIVRRPDVVHARSYLPAAVAAATATLLPRARFLFDVRGLLGEEYLDAGHWTKSSPSYRLLKAAERVLFARADGVVVLTQRHRAWLQDETQLLARSTPIEVIPCCVDTERFAPSETARAAARLRIGAGERFVLVYAGSLGGYYDAAPMLTLFSALRRLRPALLLVLTTSPAEALRPALTAAGIDEKDVRIERVAPDDMPATLAAADGAVSFYAPGLSRLGTSPTKIPEYLAMGLPVVLNRGIGDSDELIDALPEVVDGGQAGAAELVAAAARLVALATPQVRSRCRQAAIARFSLDDVGVPRYEALYDALD